MPSCPSNTALFQVASRRAVIQNDQAVQLAEGDIALVDGAGPRRMFLRMGARNDWLSICRLRQLLVSHLAFEPQGVLFGSSGTRAARLLFELVQDPENGDESASSVTDPYMQMTVYDLLGALFAPSDPWEIIWLTKQNKLLR
jgi:AraC family transcriptional regulator, positive regulator of tynA and feaB